MGVNTFRASICLLMVLALPVAAASVPVDAAGLPLWVPAVWRDFPVEFSAANPSELAALLAAAPIADFHREQVSPEGAALVVRTRVTESELHALEEAGATPRRVFDAEREIQTWIEARWAEQSERGGEALRIGERGVYHTHAQLGQILLDAQTDHPEIARRESIGFSVQGRELWTLVISDSVDVEEAEPEVRISDSIHGDEKIAVELAIYLAEYLTNHYNQPGYEDVTELVDNYEIHLLPLHNPDGHAANTRYNANGRDLNRNFPVPDGTPGGDGTYSEEIETVAMKDWGFAQHFVISQDGHGGAVVVNYPWDYTYQLAPDNDAFIRVAEEFSYWNEPMWNGDWYHGITNGAQWYVTKGSLQDWSYEETGSMHVIVEHSDVKTPPASQLDGYWDDNRESYMHWIKAARYGVNGCITDQQTGAPLDAAITVVGNDKLVYTDPDHGDYYKLLPTGTYTLRFEAEGYVTQEIAGVATTWGTPTVLDVELLSDVVAVPDPPEEPGLRFAGSFPNPFNPATTLRFTLPADRPVELRVVDSRGRRVRTLLAGETLAAGPHEIVWDGRDDRGRTVPSALYIARLVAGDESRGIKLLLLK